MSEKITLELSGLRSQLHTSDTMTSLRAELAQGMTSLKAEMENKMTSLRADVEGAVNDLRLKLQVRKIHRPISVYNQISINLDLS